jgi:hypothetical protein
MKKIAAFVAYIASIVAANALTNAFGLVTIVGLTVTAGTFVAGTALILRDAVQESSSKVFVFVAITAGAVLSAATSTPALAIASALAFAASELVDLAVYTPLSRKNVPIAVLASSVVSAPVDTILFLHLAGFGVTTNAVLGQFVVKTMLAVFVAVGLSWRSISRAA